MTTINQFSKIINSEFNAQIFIPELATIFGLEESIVLQKIHYWLGKCGKSLDDKLWIYNTFSEWTNQFSFWSQSKVKRIFYSLEEQEIIISCKHNKSKGDHTKWYSLNYEKLTTLLLNKLGTKPINTRSEKNNRMSQNEPIINSKQYINYSKNMSKDDIKKNTNTFNQYNYKQTGIDHHHKMISDEMIGIWNSVFIKSNQKLFSTANRVKKLNVLWKEIFLEDIKAWKEFCIGINSSKFLMGEKKNSFKAQFDWIIQKEIAIRVVQKEFDIGDRVPDIIQKEIKHNSFSKTYSNLQLPKEDDENTRLIKTAEKLSLKELQKFEEALSSEGNSELMLQFESFMENRPDSLFVNEFGHLFINKWANPGANFVYEQYKINFCLNKTFEDFMDEAKSFSSDPSLVNGYNNSFKSMSL